MSTAHAFVSAKSEGTDATLVGPNEWNAAHDGITDDASEPTTDQTIRAGYSAQLIGLPLIIDAGRLVSIAADGILVLNP